MIYDLALYRRTVKPTIKAWIDAKGGTPVDHAGELALASQCPIVCVVHYIGELYGYTPEVDRLLTELLEFYKPEDVINKEMTNEG